MVRRSALVLPFLLLAACTAAPAPQSAPPAQARAQVAEPARVVLLCSERARAVSFDALGVPRDEQPVAVATTAEHVWVLFQPARLLRLSRQGERIGVEMIVGPDGETWSDMDLDPTDGSVWVAVENRLVFHKVSSGWRRTAYKVQRVVGEGGFVRLLVAEDALYAVPTSADHRVWRLDRAGNVLGRSFPVPPAPQAPSTEEPVYLEELAVGLRLEEDHEGRVVVWDPEAGKAFEADGQGGWGERTDLGWFDSEFPAARVVRGVDVGTASEGWYLTGWVRDLFYWKGRPVFLGSPGYLIPKNGGRVDEVLESCLGGSVWGVASDGTSYAAFTRQAVIFGDVAAAPDLP